MDFDLAASRLAKDQQSALARSRAQRAARTISAEALREGAAVRAKAEKRLQEKSEAKKATTTEEDGKNKIEPSVHNAQPSQDKDEEKKRKRREAQARYREKNRCAINAKKRTQRAEDIDAHRKRTAEHVRNHRRRSRESESDKTNTTVTATDSRDDHDNNNHAKVLPSKYSPPPKITKDTPKTWLSDTVLQGDELEVFMFRMRANDIYCHAYPTPGWVLLLDKLGFWKDEGKAHPTSYWIEVIKILKTMK